MKNQFISLVAFLTFAIAGNAQVNPHAIGIRGGLGSFGRGGEVSYQHGFGEVNRLEVDLGWRGNRTFGTNYSHAALSGIYHWVWNIEEAFNWFAGPGAQLGFYSDEYESDLNGMTLSIGGQIGIEYDFNSMDVPLQLSIDARPMWGFIGGTSGLGYGGAFSLRYTF